MNLKMNDTVYLPSQITNRFHPLARGCVTRIFTAPAVLNPFNLSSAPLRPDTRCAEITFPMPRVTVIACLDAGDVAEIADPKTGKTLRVYVGVQAPENGSGAVAPPPPTPKIGSNLGSKAHDWYAPTEKARLKSLSPQEVLDQYRRNFPKIRKVRENSNHE